MADQLPGWAKATIHRMNENPSRAHALLSLAGWPTIGEGFEVKHSGNCSRCGHPEIDIVEPGEGETPLALVTTGCLVCDVFNAVEPEEVDLVDWDEVPEGRDRDPSDGDRVDP